MTFPRKCNTLYTTACSLVPDPFWQKLLFSWKTLGLSACTIWIHRLLQNIIIYYVVTDIVRNLIIPPAIILDECKALWGQTWASTECMCASVHACVCVCQSGQIEDGWRLHMLTMYQESIWWEVIYTNEYGCLHGAQPAHIIHCSIAEV